MSQGTAQCPGGFHVPSCVFCVLAVRVSCDVLLPNSPWQPALCLAFSKQGDQTDCCPCKQLLVLRADNKSGGQQDSFLQAARVVPLTAPVVAQHW